MDDTGLEILNENSEEITAYDLEPINASGVGRPWTCVVVSKNSTVFPTPAGRNDITVTGLWGWTSVPDTIVQATKLQALRFFKRNEAPFGIAGSPDLGNEGRLLARVDPDVSVMLNSHRRWWASV
jgi:hypothetical protein